VAAYEEENESSCAVALAGLVPLWVQERAGKAVRRLVGDLLLLSFAEHRQGWKELLPTHPFLTPRYPSEHSERLRRTLHTAAGVATELPAWIGRLVPGPLDFESVGAGRVDPASTLPVELPDGCRRAEWEAVREFLQAFRDAGPLTLQLHLVWEWGAVQGWSSSQRRAFLSGVRFQRLLSKLDGLRHLRQHFAFQDLLWSQEWRALFAPFGDEDPGPAGGGSRLRPSRVPRHLAAWLLRREGLGSQSIGYLLACFGLASADWSLPRKDAARRLNTIVGRSIDFWRGLEDARLAGGGEAAHPSQQDGFGPAPGLLLSHFIWHAWDRVTPITGVAEDVYGPGTRFAVPERAADEPLEYLPVPPVDDELADFLERLAARNGKNLVLEAREVHARRFGEMLARSHAPVPASKCPAGAVEAAAWVLAAMPSWMVRVRSGVLDPVARGWAPPDLVQLVPERPPAGLEVAQWKPARELLLEPGGSYEAVFTHRLAVARGWFDSLDDAPKPLTMLMQTALAYRDLVQTIRDDAQSELLELELELQWNQTWRAVYWPAGLWEDGSVRASTASRARGTAHLQLAAWLLRRGGFSRSLVGGLLVHLGGASERVDGAARSLARDVEKDGASTEDLLVLLQGVAKRPLEVWRTLDDARARTEEHWQEQATAAVEELFTTLQQVWLFEWLKIDRGPPGGPGC
jgi:hypothetical protein